MLGAYTLGSEPLGDGQVAVAAPPPSGTGPNAYPALLADSRFLDGLPVASSTASGSSVLNITDLKMYTYWQATGTGMSTIQVDCGSAKGANAMAMAGHNLNSAGAQVSLRYSTDGVRWAPAAATFTPDSDKAFLVQFPAQTARFWQLIISNASDAPQIAVAMIGTLFSFPRYPESGFDPDNTYINADAASSESGALLGVEIAYQEREVDVQWKYLTPDWCKNSFRPLWDGWLSLLLPFFWGWDLTNHPDEVYFMWISPGHGNSAKDGVQRTMPFDPVRRTLDLTLSGVKE